MIEEDWKRLFRGNKSPPARDKIYTKDEIEKGLFDMMRNEQDRVDREYGQTSKRPVPKKPLRQIVSKPKS